MRCWVKEDNRDIRIQGIRWLTREHRRAGKSACSPVVYLEGRVDLNRGLCMARKIFRTTE